MPSGQSRYRVLIAGAGVAALEAMVALRALAEEKVDIELLAPDRDFFYRPLAVAEPLARIKPCASTSARSQQAVALAIDWAPSPLSPPASTGRRRATENRLRTTPCFWRLAHVSTSPFLEH